MSVDRTINSLLRDGRAEDHIDALLQEAFKRASKRRTIKDRLKSFIRGKSAKNRAAKTALSALASYGVYKGYRHFNKSLAGVSPGSMSRTEKWIVKAIKSILATSGSLTVVAAKTAARAYFKPFGSRMMENLATDLVGTIWADLNLKNRALTDRLLVKQVKGYIEQHQPSEGGERALKRIGEKAVLKLWKAHLTFKLPAGVILLMYQTGVSGMSPYDDISEGALIDSWKKLGKTPKHF